MLHEWWYWLRTRSSPSARRVGHLAEAIALTARARRQRQAWAAHLQHSQGAIVQQMSRCRRYRTALVLGAGNCLDVPVSALARQFERVLLVDIVKLAPLDRLLRQHANLHFLEHDLTGIVDRLHACRGRVAAYELAAWPPPAASTLAWLGDAVTDIDFVVSANVLSQLPVKPVDYLQRQSPQLPLAELNAFAWRLLRAHVALLQSFNGPVCLITDDRQRTWNLAGELVESVELVSALGLADRVQARWRWPVAPRGELGRGYHAEHDVVAVALGSD